MKSGNARNLTSWFNRLRSSLGKSSSKLGEGITNIFVKNRLDQVTIEKIEELLIASDFGPALAADFATNLSGLRPSTNETGELVRQVLAEQIARTLDPLAIPISVDPNNKPHVMLFVGVNGTGKTTTIGKYAKYLVNGGHKVGIIAADTFRAAAVEQLQQWSERSQSRLFTGNPGADPSGLIYDAMKLAKSEALDVLLIDTAGRLNNVTNLMQELAKLSRVVKKIDATAPHNVIQVLDATTGQNAISQVEEFRHIVQVNGLIVTKLDGSASGGVVVALANRFGLPIHAIGIGEGEDDLQAFAANEFARGLIYPELQSNDFI